MPSIFSSVFSSEEIDYLLQLPEVVAAKDRFGSSNKVQFTIPLTDGIRAALQTRFGLDLSSVSEIPMRWIKGDTAAHMDRGSRSFENTYLVYLQDSEGEFVLGPDSYPITANTGFVFEEGTLHKTQNTGTEPRLLLGPMNEFAGPVGTGNNITYFSNYADAIAGTNIIAYIGGATWILGTFYGGGNLGGVEEWRVASGNPAATGVYANGYDLSVFGNYSYNVYPAITVCFLEGTQILCLVDEKETYVPIETMCTGTLVKTSRDGYKKVELIGKNGIVNPGHDERIADRLYKLSPSNYPDLKENLFITGGHSVLVDKITDKEREGLIKHIGNIYVTDKKYRLTAMVDERAEPWASEGTYTIWHFALEHEDIRMNYGVYANGLLVETCSINTMRTKSNLSLLL
jgi:hypothetical protein